MELEKNKTDPWPTPTMQREKQVDVVDLARREEELLVESVQRHLGFGNEGKGSGQIGQKWWYRHSADSDDGLLE